MRNLFIEEGLLLLSIHTKEVMKTAVINSVLACENSRHSSLPVSSFTRNATRAGSEEERLFSQANSVQNVLKIGGEEEQFKNFVKERFVKRSKLITDSLKKNKWQKDSFKRQS